MKTEISFNPFPELKTQKITLRRLKENDSIKFSELRSDEKVNEFLDRPDNLNTEDASDFIQKLNIGIENNEWIFWAISLPGNDDLIGTICLWNLDKNYGLAELGFELFPAVQGKGIMKEAIKLVLDYAFNTMKLIRIEGFTSDNNIKAFRLLERSGFTRDSELEKEISENENNFVNMVAYKIENK